MSRGIVLRFGGLVVMFSWLIGAALANARPAVTKRSIVFVIGRTETTGRQLDAIMDAIVAVGAKLGNGERLGVIAFDGRPHVLVPLEKVRVRQLRSELKDLYGAVGTNLAAGLQEAENVLQSEGQEDQTVVIVVDSNARTGAVVARARELSERNVRLVSIGLPGADTTVLRRVSELSSGRLFYLDDPARLPQLLQHVFAGEADH
jgi:hypothetical protein